ncbi:Trophoblast-specific protein beta [Apodemus speciosus]|uniref:Trophoblast-specific protein beta n=1 Tax=Apodemus speciosus TaxID=105296 RepID=A0ABQ0FGA1_APOSI
MTPRVFLVILYLGVASAAVIPNPSLDAQLQEQKDKEELKRVEWDEFIVKLHNSENDKDGDCDIEMSASGQLDLAESDDEIPVKDQDEETHRRAVWEENKKKIEAHNADYEQGKTSFSMDLNKFSDMPKSV